MSKHIPDSKLELYLLNALPEREQAEIAALEQSDEELRGRIDALRASDAEILEEYPPSRMAERLAQRYPGARAVWARKHGGARRRWPISVFICAALLLVLPILIVMEPVLFDTLEIDETRQTTDDGAVIDTMKTDTTETDSVHAEAAAPAP